VTLRARWVTLRARWVTLRARWVMLRARWVMLRACWVMLRARWVMLRACWVTFTVFDSGVDHNHAAFNAGDTGRVVPGANTRAAGKPIPADNGFDCHGHGTFQAGAIPTFAWRERGHSCNLR
jgi:hypothetical protein